MSDSVPPVDSEQKEQRYRITFEFDANEERAKRILSSLMRSSDLRVTVFGPTKLLDETQRRMGLAYCEKSDCPGVKI